MGTTRADIRRWIEHAQSEGATHLIVVCDCFDYEDYPVAVKPGENSRTVASSYNQKDMQRVMEVYNLAMDIDFQLSEHRAMHHDIDQEHKLDMAIRKMNQK